MGFTTPPFPISRPRPLALLMAGVLALFYLGGFLWGAPVLLLLAFALLGLTVLAGFLRHGDHGSAAAAHPRPVALAALGALGVVLLSRNGQASEVVAAALVGCAGALAERLGGAKPPWHELAAPLYCGAFAGMTSELVFPHPGWVVLAGALAGLLLGLLGNSWLGIGGKLGTTAFLGVVGVWPLAAAFGALGPGAHLPVLSSFEPALVLSFALASPLLTHLLSYRLGFGLVLGSALPSLAVALMAPLLHSAMWLGASFVGMTTPERLGPHPRRRLLLMGLLFALFSLGFQPRLAGLGGELGAKAAVSVFAGLGAGVLLSTWRTGP